MVAVPQNWRRITEEPLKNHWSYTAAKVVPLCLLAKEPLLVLYSTIFILNAASFVFMLINSNFPQQNVLLVMLKRRPNSFLCTNYGKLKFDEKALWVTDLKWYN